MKKKETKDIDVREISDGPRTYRSTFYALEYNLNETRDMLVGKLLTFVDTMGFDDVRSKATKDVIKKTIDESLSTMGRRLDSHVEDVKKYGIVRDEDSNERESTPVSSLEHFRWSRSPSAND